MATYYIDPTATGPGNGTLTSPFRSWTSVTWAPGNTYLQKRGTIYSGVLKVAVSGTRSRRITIGAYYRADGSDDPARPMPVIILPGRPATPADGGSIAVYRQERDFVTYRNLDIRTPNPFYVHIHLAYIYGRQTVLANNIFMGSTGGGIY